MLADSRLMVKRAVKNDAMFVFIATSKPTIKKMARIVIRIYGFRNSEKELLKVAGALTGFDSSIFTEFNHKAEIIDIAANTGNINFQLPVYNAKPAVIMGPIILAIALISCDRLRFAALLCSAEMSINSGLAETCNIVFPIPRMANPINAVGSE